MSRYGRSLAGRAGSLWKGCLERGLDTIDFVAAATGKEAGQPVFVRMTENAFALSPEQAGQGFLISQRRRASTKPAGNDPFVHVEFVNDVLLVKVAMLSPLRDKVRPTTLLGLVNFGLRHAVKGMREDVHLSLAQDATNSLARGCELCNHVAHGTAQLKSFAAKARHEPREPRRFTRGDTRNGDTLGTGKTASRTRDRNREGDQGLNFSLRFAA